MVLVTIQGGLGNQLFQFAAGYDLAKRNNSYLILDASAFSPKLQLTMSRPFKFELPFLLNFDDKTIVIHNKFLTKIIRIYFKFLDFISFNIFNYLNIQQYKLSTTKNKWPFFFSCIPFASNYYLDGYWQHLSYFNKSVSNLINLFKIPKKNNVIMTIGIHIRKAEIKNTDIDLCTPHYYLSSIKKILNLKNITSDSCIIKIYTEDIQWVKDNLNLLEYNVDFISGNLDSTLKDFISMCHCDHLIIPNSTYSWWPAYLISRNFNSLIICPDKWWTNIDISELSIYPDSWIICKSS